MSRQKQNRDETQIQETIQKVDEQVKQIDALIAQLLDGIDISELSTYERLQTISRLLALSQRGLEIKVSYEADKQDNRDVTMMTAIMQYMRGEIIDTMNPSVGLLSAHEEEL